MAMILLVTAWVAAAGFGFWWWRMSLESAEPTNLKCANRPTAKRSLDPRSLGTPATQQRWVMRSDPQCRHSTPFNGRRVRGDRAISLPSLGCGPGVCGCHFQTTPDPRRRLRRVANDRREELRFTTSDHDRRLSEERRTEARLWSKSPYAH